MRRRYWIYSGILFLILGAEACLRLEPFWEDIREGQRFAVIILAASAYEIDDFDLAADYIQEGLADSRADCEAGLLMEGAWYEALAGDFDRAVAMYDEAEDCMKTALYSGRRPADSFGEPMKPSYARSMLEIIDIQREAARDGRVVSYREAAMIITGRKKQDLE